MSVLRLTPTYNLKINSHYAVKAFLTLWVFAKGEIQIYKTVRQDLFGNTFVWSLNLIYMTHNGT